MLVQLSQKVCSPLESETWRKLTPSDALKPAGTPEGRKLEKELMRRTGEVVRDFDLVEDGIESWWGCQEGRTPTRF